MPGNSRFSVSVVVDDREVPEHFKDGECFVEVDFASPTSYTVRVKQEDKVLIVILLYISYNSYLKVICCTTATADALEYHCICYICIFIFHTLLYNYQLPC